MWRARTVAAILVITGTAAWAAVASPRDDGVEATQTVDTGLGFTLSVPATWTRGVAVRNDKFVMGSVDEDFAVIVADFGTAQADQAQALAVYRESFLKSGFTPVTELDATVAGQTTKRIVFRLDTPDGPAHAEAIMLRVGDEMFAVLVVTTLAASDIRRPAIAKIFESIALK